MDTFADDLYPLALLMDELKHDDVSNRVEAMQKLDTIAIALGPERTLNELLPFLHDVAQDDEEEVFAVLAAKLGDFIPLIGGHQHCEPLIQILAILASMEEPIVRDKAIDSLNNIALQLAPEELNGVFLDLIRLLSQGNWFSKKIASCGLYKSVIAVTTPAIRRELLGLYLRLVADDYPMVRRSAATNLPTIIDKLAEAKGTVSIDTGDWELISKMFHHLINDDQDSVKFLSIDVLISILDFFQAAGDRLHHAECLLLALKLVSDESWRVRYTAADRFSKIARNYSDDESDVSRLIDPFIALMKDNEGEVRKSIAKQLPDFCKLLTTHALTGAAIELKIIPVVAELSQDPHENVRASLASTITGLSPTLSKQATIDKLLPIFLVMLKDEFPDVRLNIILNLSVVNETIGISLLSTNLLPAITELAQDSKWRVRLAIIEYIPKLATQLGVSFFNDELLSLCMLWLWDPVFAIRDAAVGNLQELTTIFGSQWANSEIVHRILEVEKTKSTNADVDVDNNEHRVDYANFIVRITCLFAMTRLIPVIDYNIVVARILPFIDSLIADAVPNIRFNVAKSYLVLVETVVKHAKEAKSSGVTVSAKTTSEQQELVSKVLANLETMTQDSDVDVRFYASKSTQGINDSLVA